MTLELKPLRGEGKWLLELEPALVTLRHPDGRDVLMVPREDLAQYARVQRDLLKGWTVTLAVVDGGQPHVFRCGRSEVAKLLYCMPRKTEAEVRQEVRLNGVALGLFGVLYLILPQVFAWWWGVALLGLCAVAQVFPSRRVYLANGLLMFAIGGAQLMAGSSQASPGAGGDSMQALSTIPGIIFVCWAIQQFSMLSPNARIRVARVRRQRKAAGPGRSSRLIRQVAAGALGVSGVMWAYSILLTVMLWREAAASPDAGAVLRMATTRGDAVAFPILAALTLGMGLALWFRRGSAYTEAKVTLQVLVALILVVAWGAVFSFDPVDPRELVGNVALNGLHAFPRPYVWLSFLAAVLALNRWFARAVDRELGDPEAPAAGQSH